MYKLLIISEIPDCFNTIQDDTNSSCRVCVIKWLAGYTQDIKQKHYTNIPLISKFIGYIIYLFNFNIRLYWITIRDN